MILLNVLPVIMVVFGSYFILRLRGFFILHPIKTFKRAVRVAVKNSSFKSLSLALAGTLGVGNIVGIAFGISVGGAGCLFWVLISSLFASVIKYCECTLAADGKKGVRGGMMYVVSASFPKIGKLLAVVYAFSCLLLSLVMGAALQSASVIECAEEAFSINPVVIAFFLALFVFVAVLGGARKIEGVATLIIPIASAAYIIMCLFTILSNVKILPSVVTEILKGAFSFKSAASGIALYGFSSVREGFSRGLLSNEAGAGTSAMAQSRASSVSASGVGLLGILEVFFDTAFLCTLTGLSVLVSANAPQNGSGMSMVVSALSAVFGRLSAPLLFVLVFAFAYSTIICWYYYGSQCLYYLFAKEKSAVYSALYIFASFIGAWIPYELLIYTTDYILLVMSLITLITLLKKSERIVYLSEKDGLLKKSYSRQKLNSGTFK